MKNIFNYKNNELLLSYKVGKNTALFTALKIASLIEKRIKFQSTAVEKCIKIIKSSGVRVVCKGRLNFIDRAKKDLISFGPVPLQTIDANIDYGLIIANTKKGLQSIKVWIFY
jgi:small subunit ribosomal protein S3